MRLQFTIRRLLLATTAFAAVLGLCSPFDAVAIGFGIPISIVVFAFVLFVQSHQNAVDCGPSFSRHRAILAGVRRGALLGARCMVIITATLALLFWLAVSGISIYRWRWEGYNAFELIGLKEIALGLYMTFLLVGPATVIAAAMGAVIMGIGGGVTYSTARLCRLSHKMLRLARELNRNPL